MGSIKGQTALMRLLAEIRACKTDQRQSPDIRRQGVEATLARLRAYFETPSDPSDRKADDR